MENAVRVLSLNLALVMLLLAVFETEGAYNVT